MTGMQATAVAYHDAGLAVIRCRDDGTKAPRGDELNGYRWEHWQKERPDRERVDSWFKNGYPGIGVICGAVSGGLEMFEFEGRAVAHGLDETFIEAADAAGLSELVARIIAGWAERSPSGGIHWFYRCETTNCEQLALTETVDEGNGKKPRRHVLIETKGEGGFAVLAPSHGTVHQSGRPYELLSGGPATVATIAVDEREALLELARLFDCPDPEPDDDEAVVTTSPAPSSRRILLDSERRRYGDFMAETVADYNRRASWDDVLAGHFTRLKSSGRVGRWHYDGADNVLSATTNATNNDTLIVFSGTARAAGWRTYAPGVKPTPSYDKFSATVFLRERADDVNARVKVAQELRKKGYGPAWEEDDRPKQPRHPEHHGEGTPAVPTARGADPAAFFDKTGLLHADLRDAVLDLGPIRAGLGRSLWRYRDGVWLADGADEVRRRAGRLLGNRRRNSHVEGVVSDLEAEEPFITDEVPDQWVNCRNGLLDWMTGELHPHSPDVPSTYQLTVGWDPAATCPTVDKWLDDVFPEDALDLAWEIIGVAVAADTPVHRAVLLLGPGRNGKGTFLRLIMKLIGRHHVSAVTLQQLSEDKFSAAELFGKVANIAGDLDARSVKSTDIFKMATGGDPVPAQRKYGAPFNFFNRATMLFSANELPGTADLSDGFFARFVVVPMGRLLLPADGEDKTIEPRLHAELDGVLVKAVEGLRRVHVNGGFTMPQSVVEATSEYRTKADPVARFLDERMDVTGDRDDREPRAIVYEAYRQWCASEEGITHPLSARKFYDRLRTLGRGAVDPDVKSVGQRLVVGAVLMRVDVDDGWGR